MPGPSDGSAVLGDNGVVSPSERETATAAALVERWLPALDAVLDKLVRGASVADVSGGSGLVVRTAAAAFPATRFVAFDTSAVDGPAYAAVGERVRLVAAPLSGDGYDLVISLFSLSDDTDPSGLAGRVAAALARDGTWLIVEAASAECPARSAEVAAHELARLHGFTRFRRAFAGGGVVGYEARR